MASEDFAILDAHIHFFDTKRPQGVPWPAKDDLVLYRDALPDRYRKIAEPFGVRGAIEVEASPWLEDNQWVLDIAAADRMIVGTVGNLEPGSTEFRAQMDRFRLNPLFLGIRYGNLWDRDIAAQLSNPLFVAGLKALAESGLVLDTANPNPALMASMLRVSDKVPELRIVLDHVPQMPSNEHLAELAARPHIYVKISEVLRREQDGSVPLDPTHYKPRLDELYQIFGPDRLIYGSDWPNSDQWGTYGQVLAVVKSYFFAKGPEVARKYFWTNSEAAYRWRKR